MFSTASLTAFLLLAVSVAAKPIVVRDSLITLPVARKIATDVVGGLVQQGQNRAKDLISIGRAKESGISSRDANVGATNTAVSYVVEVGVGAGAFFSPSQQYTLIVDTGSSNTWVGAGKSYVKTPTSVPTKNSVNVQYGSGKFSGTEFIDEVTLSFGVSILRQSIGVASSSTGFPNVDGILGVGPVDLTIGTLSPDSTRSIPTVTDNLYEEGLIWDNLLAISFEPTTSSSTSSPDVNGELTFGGVNDEKFTGEITYVPITTTSPASSFWGIDQSIAYGSTTILSTTAGIVDTGSTLLLIATDAFKKYQSSTGGVLDSATSLLTINSDQFSNLQSLFFTIGSTTFEFTANAQIWPRALNSVIGGTPGSIYLIVADIGNNSGEGLDFINGQVFLERFYSVYDTKNQRVGLATTPHTMDTTN